MIYYNDYYDLEKQEQGYRQQMKKEISAFCKEHNVEIKKSDKWGISDVYVDIYHKYEHEIKRWQSTEADGSTINRALLLYDENDLKEYFGVK